MFWCLSCHFFKIAQLYPYYRLLKVFPLPSQFLSYLLDTMCRPTSHLPTRSVLLFSIALAFYWTNLSRHDTSLNAPVNQLIVQTLMSKVSVPPVTKEFNHHQTQQYLSLPSTTDCCSQIPLLVDKDGSGLREYGY